MKKSAQVIVVLLVALYYVIHNFNISVQESPPITQSQMGCEESEMADSVSVIEILKTQTRLWADFDNEDLCLRYTLSSRTKDDSYYFRNQIYINSEDYVEFWRGIYYKLYLHDKEHLSKLQDSLSSIAQRRNEQPADFVYTVMSFVQDIPYHYIIGDVCDGGMDFPCLGSQEFGVLSPLEFLFRAGGDCDTRTVLLYTLLKNFGYEPLIVNSQKFLHSMIALEIPTEGDYLMYNGRKFYFWETTGTGWLPGMLPPDMNDTQYWEVILDYEMAMP